LISFPLRLVSDQFLIGSGVASVRRKLPRSKGAAHKSESRGVGGECPVVQPRPLDCAVALFDKFTRWVRHGRLARSKQAADR
jgi:hypothetical protein